MNLDKEIRLAKLQIMWTIAVSSCALVFVMRNIGFLWDLLSAPLWMAVWYLGVFDLRKTIEKENEEEE